MASPADRYEQCHPETRVGDAQKQERGERMLHQSERASHRRTGRTRGVVIPRVPWHDDEQEGAA